jgi:Tfp pilus assembly protein PilV
VTGPAPSGEAGFLLVETMVAFLILAIALAIGVQSVAQGTAALRRAEAAAAADVVAREIFATRTASLSQAGAWTGRHPNGAAWRLSATPVADGRLPPLYRVTVEVQPARDGPVYDFTGLVAEAQTQAPAEAE